MSTQHALSFAALLCLAPVLAGAEASSASAPPPATVAGSSLAAGRWEGTMASEQGAAPMSLRLLPGGGGLLDLPAEGLYGYPLGAFAAEGERLAFMLGDEGGLRFDGSLVAASAAAPIDAARSGNPPRIEGRFSGASAGSFSLVLAPADPTRGQALEVAVAGGSLSGSLLLPEGPEPFPLLVLVSGAGATDRDGNNYGVPGRNDALKALALALRELGVATYRFDKRGSGESYRLAPDEEDLRFDQYVEDCAAVLAAFPGDPRFSRRAVAGHTEGALVAAAALRFAGQAARFEGLALLCPSGKGAAASVEEALASAPPEHSAEARAIMDALLRGERYAEPSPYFADFFRPSFQAYLASWFRYDLLAELAAAAGPLLLVQGNRDVQVSLAEFYPLAKARPDAAAVILPGMNHVLKEVPAELDENYRAFSDPGFPLAEGLAELLAAFARGEAPPEGLPRYDGGVMQELQGEPEAEAEGLVPAPGAAGLAGPTDPTGAPQAGNPAP